MHMCFSGFYHPRTHAHSQGNWQADDLTIHIAIPVVVVAIIAKLNHTEYKTND